MNNVVICLWVHGKAGDIDIPCGDVSVIELSGKSIRIEFIKAVMEMEDEGYLINYLDGLPTERWLDVSVTPLYDEDFYWVFNVVSYEESKEVSL